jgi:hypothetical protein
VTAPLDATPPERAAPLPEDDPLARALGALPAAPPPPDVAGVWARVDAEDARGRGGLRLLRGRAGALAAVAAVLVVAGVLAWPRSAAPPPAPAVRIAALGGPARLLRGDVAVSFSDARAGDRLAADAPATVRLGDAVTATLGAGSALALASEGLVRLDAGTAGFEVLPAAGGNPFRVHVDDRVVTDRGTRFVVARVPDPAAPWDAALCVAVEEGSVDVDGVPVPAGTGWAGPSRGTGPGAAGPLLPPLVSLELAGEARAGAPASLRLLVVNRTPFPVARPARDDVSAPVLIEVTDPEGVARTVRVTRDAVVLGDGAPGAEGDPWLAPAVFDDEHGEPPARMLTARFASLFPTAGTYRLRALHAPTGAEAGPPLPGLSVDVR